MKCYVKEREDFPLKPIYWDNHLLIIEKPAGMATQPDLHERGRQWIKEKFKKPGNVFLEPIHRLDKPVGGIVLFARTSKALSRLNEAMRQKKMEKTYRALVEGEVDNQGTLTHFLLHDEFRARLDPKGKEAVLHYKLLEYREDLSFIEIKLETGRYHQIRAQFGAIGHPVWGDAKYGSKVAFPCISLHHSIFSFPHPISGEVLTIKSEVEFSFELAKGLR